MRRERKNQRNKQTNKKRQKQTKKEAKNDMSERKKERVFTAMLFAGRSMKMIRPNGEPDDGQHLRHGILLKGQSIPFDLMMSAVTVYQR